MTDPHPATVGAGVPRPATPAPMETAAVDLVPEESASAAETSVGRPRRLTRIMWTVAGVAVVAGLAAAGVGFALSYGTLVQAAAGWGFGSWQRKAFPLGVDGLIIALYSIHLVLVWRRMAKPALLVAAHAVTAVTVALNVIAAADGLPGSPGVWEAIGRDPGRLLGHAAMPAAYVLLVEAARHLISRTARLESGDSSLSLADWLLRPAMTWWVFRTAKTYPMSYAEARVMRRDIEIHRVWIRYREEIEAARAEAAEAGTAFDEREVITVLDRLPDLLAPYGVSVDEALAMPDRMRGDEQKRRAARERADQERAHQEAADRRAREHADRMARLAAEREELHAQGEVDLLRAESDAERRAAEHRAAGHVDVAAIEAAARRSAAERAATEEQRRARAEEEAQEGARTAALRLKAAEDDGRAAQLEEEAAAVRLAAAAAEERAAKTAARAEEAAALAAAAKKRAAEDTRAAEQARAAAAELNLRASLAEEAAGLPDRDRQVRRVARIILAEAGGQALRLPTTTIQERLGIASSTASSYRDAAGRLIAAGYDPETDPLHSMDGRAWSAV
ncbi:DUF2637 domain-containing protein [Streptomyces sp. NPDC015171]|uniref:DUF2637 domain-containing protein n=1 Tax=Streptomyces sp. NPDC015171 TaxID=3364945 RepID=UPI0036FD4720